jgi:hypothetical protein
MPNGKYLMTAAMLAAGMLGTSLQANAGEGESGKATASQQMTTKGVDTSSANMMLVGQLIDTRDVTLKGVDEEKHRLLKVKPGGGAQTVIVDIGRQDAAASFGLVKGDRVIAVGKSARINDRPVLFAKSIGELYPVGRIGSVARDRDQMKQDASARGAAATGYGSQSASSPKTSTSASASGAMKQTANDSSKSDGAGNIEVPDAPQDEVVVLFNTDNLGTDQYGTYDKDFVWSTTDPGYSTWNPGGSAMAWNDNWETPHWDLWGYDDADEWGLFDW